MFWKIIILRDSRKLYMYNEKKNYTRCGKVALKVNKKANFDMRNAKFYNKDVVI